MVKKLEESPAFPGRGREAAMAGLLAAWGVLCGWLFARFLFLSGEIIFLPPVLEGGARNYCEKIGYAKQADYFWFASVFISAWAGAALALGARALLNRLGWKGLVPRWAAPAGLACLALAFALSIPSSTQIPRLPLFLAIAGFFLPWMDRRWMGDFPPPDAEQDYSPGRRRIIRWALLAFVLVLLDVLDGGMMWRKIDGLHEGAHLLYIQSALSGDVPGLAVRTEYSPLYINSLWNWMRLFGMTLSSERWYFQAAQVLGAFIHILALCWVCRNRVGAFTGFWAMLFLSIAPFTLYGYTNSFRTALPLAALVVGWRGLEAGRAWIMALSGALLAGGALYSQEFAVTSLLACLAMLGAVAVRGGWRGAVRPFAAWAGAGVAVFLSLMLAIFGLGAGEALNNMFEGGYVSSRLYGHGARPFPRIPWIGHWAVLGEQPWVIFDCVYLWWPAFLGGAVGAWLVASGRAALSGRRLLALGLVVSGLASVVPAIVRPMGNLVISGSMVPMLALGVLAIDWMWERNGPRRIGAVLLACLFAGMGLARIYILETDIKIRLSRMFDVSEKRERQVPRLGRVNVTPAQEDGFAFLAKRIQEWCPPDKRVYMAAPFYNHLLFLSGRAGLPPYPAVAVAASGSARSAMIRALEREKPPLALITNLGVDIPFAEEHAEEWDYIQKHYRLSARAEELMIYTRKQ